MTYSVSKKLNRYYALKLLQWPNISCNSETVVAINETYSYRVSL